MGLQGYTGGKKRHCFTQMFITSKLHYWYTSDQCQPTIFGGQTLSLCQLLGKCCCKKLVILKGNRSSSTSQVVEGKSTPLQCKQTNSAEQSRVTANTVKWWRPNRKPKEVKLNNIMTHWMLTRKKSFQMSVFWPKTDKCPPHTYDKFQQV